MPQPPELLQIGPLKKWMAPECVSINRAPMRATAFPRQPEEGWTVETQLHDPRGKAVFAKALRAPVPAGAHGKYRACRRSSLHS